MPQGPIGLPPCLVDLDNRPAERHPILPRRSAHVFRLREGPTMFYQTEAKPQGWRAVAVFDDDRAECLLYLGRSSTQVRAGYAESYLELLDDEEREHVQSIALQRWHGAPDAGRWMHQTTLKVPVPVKLVPAAA